LCNFLDVLVLQRHPSPADIANKRELKAESGLSLVSCLRKFATKFNRHSWQAGDSWHDPESRNFKNFWMRVFTGMTVRVVVRFVN
jgi:hypothetical protein